MKFSVSLTMERFSPGRTMETAMSELLELARMADEGGFETLWTAEHHTLECTISPNPFQTLVWLAQHTRNIRLGTSTLVAPYWNPIRLAGEAALCDHLTGGRLEFGIARGSYQYEFDRMAGGMVQQEGVAYLKEIVPAIIALWKGDYAHDGNTGNSPLQPLCPSHCRSFHRSGCCARSRHVRLGRGHRANLLTTPLSAPATEIGVLADKFEKAVADHPGVPRPRFMMQRRTCVYDKPDGWELAVRHSSDYGRYFENLMQNIGTVKDGFPEAVPFESVAGRDNYNPESIRKNLMFGTPDEVIEKLLDYEAAGVDQYCLGLTFNLPFELRKRTLELWIKEIMPVFAQRERECERDRRKQSAISTTAG
jgi:alkanesulfonate monooxygenase SsuD/methylene tetrahydromethanopterin reductase-like flavin-dependent oxidoreductase (luciferase family)